MTPDEEKERSMNDELCVFARRWMLDGDWLKCRKCKRAHIASKHREAFIHAADCKAVDGETHPWHKLMEILGPMYAALRAESEPVGYVDRFSADRLLQGIAVSGRLSKERRRENDMAIYTAPQTLPIVEREEPEGIKDTGEDQFI